MIEIYSVYSDIVHNNENRETTIMFSKIAGITFNNRQVLAAKCYKGMKLYLKREPQNRFDPNAVAIYMGVGIHQLGFIPKETAKSVSRILDSGRNLHCYVEQVNVATTGIIGINIKITEYN